MHGLTRVRQFTITEAHIILRPDQAEEELTRCTELCNYVMKTLGIDGDVTYRLYHHQDSRTLAAKDFYKLIKADIDNRVTYRSYPDDKKAA